MIFTIITSIRYSALIIKVDNQATAINKLKKNK